MTKFLDVSLPQTFVSALGQLFVRQLEISGNEASRLTESLFGHENITFGQVIRVTSDDLRIALDQAGIKTAVIKVSEMVELLTQINQNTLVCNACGEFPLAHNGGNVSEIKTAGNACPFCKSGHVEINLIKLRMLAWPDGALVSPETRQDFRTIPGETLELQDDGILVSIGGRLDKPLRDTLTKADLPIYGLLAYMRLEHKRIHSDEDVKKLLQHPEEFGLNNDRLDQVVEEAKEFLASREITNLPPKPKTVKKPQSGGGKGGKIIGGHWCVVEKIGEGRLGTTYLVYNTDLGETATACAKHCFLVTPENIQALKAEALAIWPLGHSALPAFRDFVTLNDGSVLIVMKHFAGPTLRQVLDKVGVLDPYHASWIMERALWALAYLHSEERIHGDICPEHIILRDIENHQIGLVGFSLATTETGAVSLGHSDKYSPPEQIRGELLPSSDFYALARTIIETMVGPAGLESSTMPDGIRPVSLRRLLKQMASHDIAERPENPLETLKEIRNREFGSPDSRAISRPFPRL